jgi:4-amino-4-deoxy-L-arabinose transferase-like glycosyltransferase
MDTMTFTPAPSVAATTAAPPHTGVRPDEVDAHSEVPGRGRAARLWRGPEGDPTWARPALIGLLLGTAILYFYNLTSSGYANSFYSAAVQAGSASWKAFLYGSSDAASSITVDKPPASLWLMALSVRVFGLSSFAILLPQVLMGVGTVGVVYAAVKRYFSTAAGLLAGVVMALTPVAVLMFRFNNPDALLTMLMALGAYATMRSIEKGAIRWMAITGVFIGLGFLTKTLQVFLVVPFFGLAYLLFANTTLRRRVIGSVAAVATMVLSAGWWVAIVELVPASMRPYIGGSQDNDFLSVTFGYNGFGRLTGNETGSVGGGGNGTNGGNWGATGIGRLFNSEIGGQISWLIPSALILLAVGFFLRGRMPRTDLRRAAYVVWGGWLLVTALTFSFMAGIFHAYYTVALAPAVAALVGMGAVEAWEKRRHPVATIALSAATAAAAVWGFVLLTRTTAYGSGLRILVLAVGLAAAILMLAVNLLHKKAIPLVIAGAIVAGLAGPTAYSLTTVSTGHTGSIVDAGPSTGGMGGMGGGPGGGTGGQRGQFGPPGTTTGGITGGTGTQANGGTATGGATGTQGGPGGGIGGLLNASTPSTEVVAALSANASHYTWVAAAIGSQNAAGLQLGTQLPVMAIGGFNGSDPSPTLAQFQAYVAAGKIHYFVASGTGGGGAGGASNGVASQISTWVAANYTAVTIGSQTFYDLTQPVSSTTSGTTSTATT